MNRIMLPHSLPSVVDGAELDHLVVTFWQLAPKLLGRFGSRGENVVLWLIMGVSGFDSVIGDLLRSAAVPWEPAIWKTGYLWLAWMGCMTRCLGAVAWIPRVVLRLRVIVDRCWSGDGRIDVRLSSWISLLRKPGGWIVVDLGMWYRVWLRVRLVEDGRITVATWDVGERLRTIAEGLRVLLRRHLDRLRQS